MDTFKKRRTDQRHRLAAEVVVFAASMAIIGLWNRTDVRLVNVSHRPLSGVTIAVGRLHKTAGLIPPDTAGRASLIGRQDTLRVAFIKNRRLQQHTMYCYPVSKAPVWEPAQLVVDIRESGPPTCRQERRQKP